ncbi:hypothetical protein GCM10027360_90800 [Amycolatopsis echigonensis]
MFAWTDLFARRTADAVRDRDRDRRTRDDGAGRNDGWAREVSGQWR